MNPNWYPGYYLDPKNMWEWLPEVFPHWLPPSLVRTPPEIPPEQWPEPSASPKPAYSLLDGLVEKLRERSAPEPFASVLGRSLFPDPPGERSPRTPESSSFTPATPTPQPVPPWLPGAQWSSAKETTPWPEPTPEMHRAWMDKNLRPYGAEAPVVLPEYAPPPPVPYMESASYFGAGPTSAVGPQAPYLSPVPPAPAWNEVRTRRPATEAEIFAAPPALQFWHSTVPLSFDEAAAAMAARRAGAMTTGQWRGRGTEEYEPPPPPAPRPQEPPEPVPPGPERNHAFFSNRGSFFVRDRTGNYYPATFLTYSDGTPVVDEVLAKGLSAHRPDQLALFSNTAGTIYNPNNLPDPGNGNPNSYLVVPDRDFVNIMVSRGLMYGDQVRADEVQRQAGGEPTGAHASVILSGTFAPKLGYGDPQYQMGGTGWGNIGPLKDSAVWLGDVWRTVPPRPGDWTPSDHLIPAFTNAGNYGIGAFYQGAGLPVNDALRVFGPANERIGAGNVGGHSTYPEGTSEWQYNALKQGYGDTDLNTKLYSYLGVPAVAPNTSRAGSLMDSLGRLITDQFLTRPAY